MERKNNMTREEQIHNQATNYGYAVAGGSTLRPPVSKGFFDGAKWADANQPNTWISVEDKLPDDGVLVLVAYRWILGEILYSTDTFHIDYGWEDYEDVIAWMPIPELPKEE